MPSDPNVTFISSRATRCQSWKQETSNTSNGTAWYQKGSSNYKKIKEHVTPFILVQINLETPSLWFFFDWKAIWWNPSRIERKYVRVIENV